MLSTIEREIYVIDKCYAKPIYYKQGTNAISLKFNFKDYTIPTGSVAKAYVNKPSGKATYLTATITEDNAVIVKPKTQMFSEYGKSGLHIKITKNEDVLMSFEYTINVEKNPIAGEVPPSENESDMMDSMLELLKIEVNKATLQATQTVQAEGAKQIQAVQTAAQEIIADREQIQKNKADIASLTQNKADAIVNTATGEHIAAGDSSGHLLDNLKIYGKSVQNGTPTPDNPVPIASTGDTGKIEISIHGKQLFDASKIPTKSAGGATVTNNGDGSFTISGSGSLTAEITTGNTISGENANKIFKTGTITLRGGINKGIYFEIGFKSPLGNKYLRDGGLELTPEYLESLTKVEFIFYGVKGNAIPNETCKPMLYQDGDGTWEPFQPLQSLSIPTPNSLLGIPVESNGNYTDATGQQWICDYVNLKKGRIIKNIISVNLEEITFALNNTLKNTIQFTYAFNILIKNELICNRFKKINSDKDEEGIWIYDNLTIVVHINKSRGILTPEALRDYFKNNKTTVHIAMKDPNYTDIPQETLVAYKKLHSNYPSTVIQNDSGAGMELSYVADTKNYTDNKIKEAVSAQMQNLANLLSLMPLSTQAAMIEADTNNILDNMEVQK